MTDLMQTNATEFEHCGRRVITEAIRVPSGGWRWAVRIDQEAPIYSLNSPCPDVECAHRAACEFAMRHVETKTTALAHDHAPSCDTSR